MRRVAEQVQPVAAFPIVFRLQFNAATEQPDSKVLVDYCASDRLPVNWLYDENLGDG